MGEKVKVYVRVDAPSGELETETTVVSVSRVFMIDPENMLGKGSSLVLGWLNGEKPDDWISGEIRFIGAIPDELKEEAEGASYAAQVELDDPDDYLDLVEDKAWKPGAKPLEGKSPIDDTITGLEESG